MFPSTRGCLTIVLPMKVILTWATGFPFLSGFGKLLLASLSQLPLLLVLGLLCRLVLFLRLLVAILAPHAAAPPDALTCLCLASVDQSVSSCTRLTLLSCQASSKVRVHRLQLVAGRESPSPAPEDRHRHWRRVAVSRWSCQRSPGVKSLSAGLLQHLLHRTHCTQHTAQNTAQNTGHRTHCTLPTTLYRTHFTPYCPHNFTEYTGHCRQTIQNTLCSVPN